GFAVEALDGPRRQVQGAAQHLERHAPVERHLAGLVDDAHAAAADLPDDLEIAQAPVARGRVGLGSHGTSRLHAPLPPASLAADRQRSFYNTTARKTISTRPSLTQAGELSQGDAAPW